MVRYKKTKHSVMTVKPNFSTQFFADFLNLVKNYSEGAPTSSVRRYSPSFLHYLEENVSRAKRVGNVSAYEKLSTTVARFKKFLSNNHLMEEGDFFFYMLTPDLLRAFEKEMKEDMLSLNTISFYMRVLRSYYNKAAIDGLHNPIYDPFKCVYTGVQKTKKRAVELEVLEKIRSVRLPDKLHFSRDLFLFSFYTRGMSFVDIANLKRQNLSSEEITYYRSKTGQLIRIRLEPCIQSIIDKYRGESGGDYIFPIILKGRKVRSYNSALKCYNYKLRQISEYIGIEKPLTSYVSRHSWASVAKQIGVPILTISEGMGHTSERTTQIYLTSLNQETIDDANRLIISSLQ